jgi:hypothetical protein
MFSSTSWHGREEGPSYIDFVHFFMHVTDKDPLTSTMTYLLQWNLIRPLCVPLIVEVFWEQFVWLRFTHWTIFSGTLRQRIPSRIWHYVMNTYTWPMSRGTTLPRLNQSCWMDKETMQITIEHKFFQQNQKQMS